MAWRKPSLKVSALGRAAQGGAVTAHVRCAVALESRSLPVHQVLGPNQHERHLPLLSKPQMTLLEESGPARGVAVNRQDQF